MRREAPVRVVVSDPEEGDVEDDENVAQDEDWDGEEGEAGEDGAFGCLGFVCVSGSVDDEAFRMMALTLREPWFLICA